MIFQLTDPQTEEWTENNTVVIMVIYLVSAPAPKSQHRETKYEARPGNVSCNGIPEQMEGICTWEVTGCVWDRDLWDCCAVLLLKSFIPANFFKSWKENASDLRAGASCKIILSESRDCFSFMFLLSPLLFIPPLLLAVKVSVSTEVSWILPRVLVV